MRSSKLRNTLVLDTLRLQCVCAQRAFLVLFVLGKVTFEELNFTFILVSEELATAAALRQQQALLTRLAELAADSSADDAAAINALRQQIQALKVTGRQKINLDPDIVRVAERGNPPLQGSYTLWVGPPPSTVTLFGLISRPARHPQERGYTR